jgi:type II secretory pathway component PulK
LPVRKRRSSGIVLVVVLVFALLLASTVATFLRRATVDALIARNRESAARAEAIARGGIRLATVLILEDKLQGADAEADDGSPPLWSQVGYVDIPIDEISSLRLRVQDAGEKLNLNAVFQFDDNGQAHENALPFLQAMLEKVIDEMPVTPAEKALYDIPELAANLIDFVDEDDLRQRGGAEDDLYQRRDPPQRAANTPLLSLDQLRLVEGFDTPLAEALRPYVTVYPYAGRTGINPNTAPPHVLALLFFNDGVDFALAQEDTVREILEIRQEEGELCGEGQSGEGCTPIGEIVTNASGIYPPPTYRSDVFTATAAATVAGVSRTIEAVLDRKLPGAPLLLSWRVL